ncbi:hypothetical protein [Bacillus sp. REN3]|nr:hypothetical protein [Bacillus sp. REN3]
MLREGGFAINSAKKSLISQHLDEEVGFFYTYKRLEVTNPK